MRHTDPNPSRSLSLQERGIPPRPKDRKPGGFLSFLNGRTPAIALALLGWLWLMGGSAFAAPAPGVNPLEPADTSSPRGTLQGFLQVMDERYESMVGQNGAVTRYLQSDRLFPEAAQFGQALAVISRGRAVAAKYLDLGALPAATVEQVSWRLTMQLKEILDRIELPSSGEIPDAAMMQSLPYKKWTVPGTEIRIGLIETGPRAGEYVFTQETVRQIPAFFERIKDQPNRSHYAYNMYDLVFHKPSGLGLLFIKFVPLRWFLTLPAWTETLILDQPLWRWAAMALVFGLLLGIFWACLRIAQKLRSGNTPAANAWTLLPALSLLFLMPATNHVMSEVLEVSPSLYGAMTLALWGLFYLALTWLVWVLGRLAGDWLISIERLKSDSSDSQLIRLAARLIAMVLAVGILIEGANRVGLPSYSVIAGLGIGGLAAALAGQQALANLFGSLIIMFEKPFRIGHSIRTVGIEGRVEDIGFRSTRLRTPENTLMLVPSNELIRHTIENLTARKLWRVKRTLYLSVTTPVARVRAYRDAVETLLQADADLKQDSIQVALTHIGLTGYELLVDFAIRAPDNAGQLRKTDQILTAIADLAEQHQVSFQ